MRRLVTLAGALALAGCATMPSAPTVSPRFVPDTTWVMEGGDGSRRSATEAAPKVSFDQGNRYVEVARPDAEGKSGEPASPLVVGEVILFGTAKGGLTAMELKSGRVLWTHQLRGRPQASPAWVEGKVVVGDDAGWIEAIDAQGKKVWEFKASNAVSSPVVVASGRVYVSSLDQNYWCLDGATGKPLWQFESEIKREGAIWRGSSPAVADGRAFLGLTEGEVLALDALYGRTLWKVTLPEKTAIPDITAGPVADGAVVYAGAHDGPIAALDAATGATLWKKPLQPAGSFAVGPDALYVGLHGGEFVALRKTDGEKLWSVTLERGAATAPVLAGGRLYVGMSHGYFYELDARTGAVLQSFAPGSGIGARAWVGEAGVAFVSNAGVLHIFDRRP